MPRLILLTLLLLAACGGERAAPVTTDRDPSAPFASIASFDPVRFGGRWYEVAAFPSVAAIACLSSWTEYTPRPDGTLGLGRFCRSADGSVTQTAGRAIPVGPGRLSVTFAGDDGQPATWWVLWVDEGYRTAVIGTQSGRGAWVLNRDPNAPADRLAAAREILDFYGYDPSRLRQAE